MSNFYENFGGGTRPQCLPPLIPSPCSYAYGNNIITLIPNCIVKNGFTCTWPRVVWVVPCWYCSRLIPRPPISVLFPAENGKQGGPSRRKAGWRVSDQHGIWTDSLNKMVSQEWFATEDHYSIADICLYCFYCKHIPYGGKISLGANFRDFCGQTCFCEKPRKNEQRWKLMTSLCAYVNTNLYLCEWDCSLQSVCLLNGHCREDSASYCTCTNANKPVRDTPWVVEVEISSAEPFYSTSQFLTHGGSPDALLIGKVSIQKEG